MKTLLQISHEAIALAAENKRLKLENMRLRLVEKKHNDFIDNIIKQDSKVFAEMSAIVKGAYGK